MNQTSCLKRTNDLGRAGLGSCLLGVCQISLLLMQLALYVHSSVILPFFFFCDCCVLNLADISPVVKVRFINFERTKLPKETLEHNLDEKRKYFSDVHLKVVRSDAEVQVCSLFPYVLFYYIDDICKKILLIVLHWMQYGLKIL